MPKSIAEAREEQARLGRETFQFTAQEDTLASILSQLDITLSELRDALTGVSPDNKTLKDLYDELSSILAQLDVALSTRASESTLGQIKTNTDNIGTPLQDTKIANPIPQEAITYEPKISINKDNVGLAKEGGNLASILGQLDITLSALRDALLSGTASYPGGLDDIYNKLNTQLDVLLSTRASEATLTDIKTNTDNIPSDPAREGGNLATIASQLDITLSALRDALRGASTKDFSTLEADVESIYSKLNAQLDITISALRDALKGASNKDFTTLEAELDKKPDEATTPNPYNVTLTNADTEYSQALPDGTKALEFWARESVDIRFAFTSGKVATPTEPYFTLKAGTTYYKENINLIGKTLYLASSVASVHVEVIAWT